MIVLLGIGALVLADAQSRESGDLLMKVTVRRFAVLHLMYGKKLE